MAFFATPGTMSGTAVGAFGDGMKRQGGSGGRKRPWRGSNENGSHSGASDGQGRSPGRVRPMRWSDGNAGAGRYPVSRYGTSPTRERIWPGRPSLTCPSANAIMIAKASPTRVFIAAWPRM